MIASTPCDTYESSMSASKLWCEYPLSAGRPGKPSCAAQHVGDHVVVDDLAIRSFIFEAGDVLPQPTAHRGDRPLHEAALRIGFLQSAPALPRGHHPLRQRDVTICLSMLRRRQQMHPLFIEAADDKVHRPEFPPRGQGGPRGGDEAPPRKVTWRRPYPSIKTRAGFVLR